MMDFLRYGIRKPHILYPDASCDMTKWAVIACDQFSSQPSYWKAVEDYIGSAPSARNIMYPECYLKDAPAPVAQIRDYMEQYQKDVLTKQVNDFVLVERDTHSGKRLGLMAEVDLECYDFNAGAKSLIRATEGTILSRLPARVEVRKMATVEMPHVMVLVDDKKRTLLEPLRENAKDTLYDFDLMMDGGHIKAWRVTDDARIASALEGLLQDGDGFLFAMGDGNHSLAAARQCWLDMKNDIPEEAQKDHPMRYALVEICNLYGDGMAFEPIHRALFGANPAELAHDFVMDCRTKGICVASCEAEEAQLYLLGSPVKLINAINPLALATLQPFLDAWVKEHEGVSVDYIHGEDALADLEREGAATIQLGAFDKTTLFDAVRVGGALPRKTFSMGDAQDKRYYLECRALV